MSDKNDRRTMVRVDALSGYTLAGYQLLNLIGQGNAGAVYRAFSPAAGHFAALKVMSHGLDTQDNAERRFLHEARTIATLQHPHIVPIYEFGTDGGYAFIAMQLLTGGTLHDRLAYAKARSRLPSPGEVAWLVQQIASALTFAHRYHVVHRDVKPQNVMFDEAGKAYLADFGIAKDENATTHLTSMGMVLGTPPYIAPEQWRDEMLSPAVDQYALGVMSYQLLTGQLPFNAPSSHALMYKHLHDAPPPVHLARAGLPAALTPVLGRALAKNPADRYPSAVAFAEALAGAIVGMEGAPTGFLTQPIPTREQLAAQAVQAAQAAQAVHMTQRGTEAYPAPGVGTPQPTTASLSSSPPSTSTSPPSPSPYGTLFLDDVPHQDSQPRARAATDRPQRLGLSLGLGMVIGLVAVAGCALAALVAGLALFNSGGGEGAPSVVQGATESVAEATGDTIAVPPSEPGEPTTPAPTGITLVPVGSGDETPFPSTPAAPLPGETLTPITLIPPVAFATLDPSRLQVSEERVISTGNTVVRCIAYNPEGTQLATGGNGADIQVWDVATGQQIRTLSGHYGVVYALAYSPDGRLLASGGDDLIVRLWDTATGELLRTLPGHTADVRRALFSGGGTTLITSSDDQTVRFWDVNTGQELRQLVNPQSRSLGLAIGLNNTRLFTSWAGDTIVGWELDTGTQRVSMAGHQGEVRALAADDGSGLLASGGVDTAVRLWNMETGEEVAAFLDHPQTVFDVAFSPDGHVLASGDGGNDIYLWDVQNGTRLQVLEGHFGYVFDVEFSPAGGQLASGGGDGTLRLWQLSSGE